MRYQSGPGFCGPTAVLNTLRALGIRAREDHVIQYTGATTAHGTTEHGLKQALERYSCTHQDLCARRYAAAEEILLAHLKSGPAVLLTEDGGHWVTAFGLLGNRVIVFDSQTCVRNRSENGVHVLQAGEQLRRYWDPCGGKRYALLVTGP